MVTEELWEQKHEQPTQKEGAIQCRCAALDSKTFAQARAVQVPREVTAVVLLPLRVTHDFWSLGPTVSQLPAGLTRPLTLPGLRPWPHATRAPRAPPPGPASQELWNQC